MLCLSAACARSDATVSAQTVLSVANYLRSSLNSAALGKLPAVAWPLPADPAGIEFAYECQPGAPGVASGSTVPTQMCYKLQGSGTSYGLILAGNLGAADVNAAWGLGTAASPFAIPATTPPGITPSPATGLPPVNGVPPATISTAPPAAVVPVPASNLPPVTGIPPQNLNPPGTPVVPLTYKPTPGYPGGYSPPQVVHTTPPAQVVPGVTPGVAPPPTPLPPPPPPPPPPQVNVPPGGLVNPDGSVTYVTTSDDYGPVHVAQVWNRPDPNTGWRDLEAGNPAVNFTGSTPGALIPWARTSTSSSRRSG